MNPTQPFHTSRRTFLKQSAAFAVPFVAPQILAQSVAGANSKLNLAWVGLGSQGSSDLGTCAGGNNVVALCDCDPNRWGRHQQKFPQAKFYKDFRKMLEEMGDKIDAVGIGTPDHNHFAVAYMAMSMGKHVFVQKPLTHSVWEARTLLKLATEKNLVTQMGNQGHASEGARLIKEWYQAGLIGKVETVLASTNRPATGVGFGAKRPKEGGFPEAEPLPEGMDWDMWLGPVGKEVPYSRSLHPLNWRPWWDFGCGGLGDIGCHTIDTAYWALDLGAPDRVDVVMKGEPNPIFTPSGSIVSFHFPARNGKPPVTIKWHEGGSKMEIPADMDGKLSREGGFIMVGEKGGIYHGGMRPNSPALYPQARWEDYRANPDQQVPKTLPRVKGGLHQDWVNSVKNGTKACSDFSYSAGLTEVILLGTLAIRTGKGFSWNAEKMEISDNPAAAALLKVEARKGWRIEDLA
jgi:predicted dehydrogenase